MSFTQYIIFTVLYVRIPFTALTLDHSTSVYPRNFNSTDVDCKFTCLQYHYVPDILTHTLLSAYICLLCVTFCLYKGYGAFV